MIDLVKEIAADEIDVDDELDLDGDEYGDNEQAISGYALVTKRTEWYDDENYPWVTVVTSQGEFDMPAGHLVKVKVVE
jgi:hypothetical protein